MRQRNHTSLSPFGTRKAPPAGKSLKKILWYLFLIMALLMIFGGLLKGGRNQEIDPRIPIIAVMGKTGVGKVHSSRF